MFLADNRKEAWLESNHEEDLVLGPGLYSWICVSTLAKHRYNV
jgi:hypothetical protein